MAGKRKPVEMIVEDDEAPIVAEKVDKNESKGLDRARRNLMKIENMQVETTKDYTDLKSLKSFHSGCTPLDTIIGYRGYVEGKIIEIFGKESSGKSTLAMQAVNSVVNDYGGYALIMDIENNAWDFPRRSIQLGLKKEGLDRIICIHPGTCEDAMNAAYGFVKDMVIDSKIRDVPIIVVWDSIAASTSEDEKGKDIGVMGYPKHCLVINQGHRKLLDLINENVIKNVTFIWLNQAREGQAKVSFMPPPATTFGGKAPAFNSAIRIELKPKKNILKTVLGQKIQVGKIITAKTIKNKLAYANQTTDIYLMFENGIDDALTTYEWLKLYKIIKPCKADENGNDECLSLLSENGTENSSSLLRELKFSKVSGFRRIFTENKDAIQSMMRTFFDDLLSSCSRDLMSSDSDEPTEE